MTLSLKLQNWILSIATGKVLMGQRKWINLVKSEEEVRLLISYAEDRGVHLLKLSDDKGELYLAASKNPFVVLC